MSVFIEQAKAIVGAEENLSELQATATKLITLKEKILKSQGMGRPISIEELALCDIIRQWDWFTLFEGLDLKHIHYSLRRGISLCRALIRVIEKPAQKGEVTNFMIDLGFSTFAAFNASLYHLLKTDSAVKCQFPERYYGPF